MFLVYLGCVSTCFCISTFYHVFRNHSVRAYANWLIADINGVGTIPSALVLVLVLVRVRVCGGACACAVVRVRVRACAVVGLWAEVGAFVGGGGGQACIFLVRCCWWPISDSGATTCTDGPTWYPPPTHFSDHSSRSYALTRPTTTRPTTRHTTTDA